MMQHVEEKGTPNAPGTESPPAADTIASGKGDTERYERLVGLLVDFW